MIQKKLITALLLATGLLLASLVFAQDEAPAPEQEDEASKTGSQETEYSDDNYRRFMELKDQPGPTSTLPTNTYQAGTEKLDELPEASQKHLRNQLREIILESDEWAPGDEDGEYPFVASEAGEKSPALKQQEAEAWGELVGKYHEREAQIYANAARSDSATGTEGGAPDTAQANAGESAGKQGSSSGEGGEGEEQKQAGQEGQSAENQTASNPNEGSDSPSSASASAGDPNAVSTSGVSQSALEYLLSNNNKAGNGSKPSGSPAAPGSNAGQQTPQQQAGTSDPGQTGSPSEQTAAQQSATQQATAQQQASPAESAQAESESPSQQQDPQQDQQQQATEQNASEFVVISKGTLSIKELQNAQGITISTGSNSSPTTPGGTEDDHQPNDDDG